MILQRNDGDNMKVGDLFIDINPDYFLSAIGRVVKVNDNRIIYRAIYPDDIKGMTFAIVDQDLKDRIGRMKTVMSRKTEDAERIRRQCLEIVFESF
jgi:hypothetical protein